MYRIGTCGGYSVGFLAILPGLLAFIPNVHAQPLGLYIDSLEWMPNECPVIARGVIENLEPKTHLIWGFGDVKLWILERRSSESLSIHVASLLPKNGWKRTTRRSD